MTENKRFTMGTYSAYDISDVKDKEYDEYLNIVECCNLLNDLNDKNEQLKKELNAYKNFSDRKLAENKRIHKDWDKLWQLCTDKGFTEEELIKELER